MRVIIVFIVVKLILCRIDKPLFNRKMARMQERFTSQTHFYEKKNRRRKGNGSERKTTKAVASEAATSLDPCGADDYLPFWVNTFTGST